MKQKWTEDTDLWKFIGKLNRRLMTKTGNDCISFANTNCHRSERLFKLICWAVGTGPGKGPGCHTIYVTNPKSNEVRAIDRSCDGYHGDTVSFMIDC